MTPTALPPLWWLHCHRCGTPFYTPVIRQACDPCNDAAALHWPSVIEIRMEVSGG